LSPVRELEALFEGRQWDGGQWEMTGEGRMKRKKGRTIDVGRREAAHHSFYHPVLIVAALRLSVWVFSGQQGGEGERASVTRQ
jgi:hypothetical protein